MHEVYLERRAEKDLKAINPEDFEKIIEEIKKLQENPRPKGSRKIASSKDDYRIRVGDYRIIYEVSDKEKQIRIMRVRHRREVYR